MGTRMSRPERGGSVSPRSDSWRRSTCKEKGSKEKKGFQRHHTVANINESHAIQQTLFRHASHGDFRQQIHDDLKSVSKRFNQVLGRTEIWKEDKDCVTYKHDFQTKYLCNMTTPLSHGRYATVTAAENCITAQNVAVKIIRKDKLFDRKSGKRCAGENVRVEVLALRNLANKPNVVKFFDVFEDEAFFYVVMELCKGGNLLERINKGGPMREEQAGPLLKQMLTVTELCHSHGIAHRDLKLENFVFLSDNEDYPLNLVDFGSAAFFKPGQRRPFKGAVGTFNYMAPEVYDSSYGPSADVWSLGIIGYAMLCSSLPFTASSDEELKEKVQHEELGFSHSSWLDVSDSAKDLKKMLEKNPDFRITTSEALNWVDCKGGRGSKVEKISKWVSPREEGNGSRAFESTSSSKGAVCYRSKKAEIEQLWQELFWDPREWWDHRFDKVNPKFPDFKHKKQTDKALWLNIGWIPPWVKGKLAALPRGTIQLSTYSLNKRLSRYVQTGQYGKTIELFQQMQQDGHTADRFTFPTVLKACASLGLFEYGRLIHAMMQPGLEEDLFIGSSLVDMYAKCGRIEEAQGVFNQMPARDVVAWTALILGYVKCGEGHKALDLFEQMQQQGVVPDSLTFVGVLNACASVVALEVGRRAHEEIIRRGYEVDIVVANSLVDMYAKCGSIEEAERVFNQMLTRNVVAWNAMIFGYVKCGEGQKALELFEQMKQHGVNPDSLTFVAVLNACASEIALEGGRSAHKEIIRRGYEVDLLVGNSLVDMYAKCGSIEEAERVFNEIPTRNVVAWNTIIFGYVKCGEGQKALDLFKQLQVQGLDPDTLTFIGVLNACASVATLEGGRHVHEKIIQKGLDSDVVVGTSLIDMYAKCGSIEEAVGVFNKMPTRDVVSWRALIFGYIKCGEGQKALDLFEQMQVQGLDPDSLTFVGVVNACASVAALERGKRAHKEIISRGYGLDIIVGTCLIDMYAKCGIIEEAEKVFKEMPIIDVVAWTAMLAAYGSHGYARKAIETFEQMSKLVPLNSATFVSLLSACSHGGLVDEGLHYLNYMNEVYNITPTVDHYSCVVDLLGRAGHLGEAEDLIMSMPVEPNACVWMSLLSACRVHVNVELGEHCGKELLELEPENASDLYVAADKWESRAIVRQEKSDGLEGNDRVYLD